MYNLNQIEKVLEENNALLAKTKKKYSYESRDTDGNIVGSTDYYAEKCLISKVQGKTGSYYTINKVLTNPAGKKINLVFTLTIDEVEYIDYNKDDILKKMYVNTSREMLLRMRVVYGTNDNSPYVCFQIMLTDRIRKVCFLKKLKLDIFLNAMSSNETAFDVIVNKKLDIEELSEDEIQLL